MRLIPYPLSLIALIKSFFTINKKKYPLAGILIYSSHFLNMDAFFGVVG